MILGNISSRPVELRDTSLNVYIVPAFGDLSVADSLWSDQVFRDWMHYRVRDLLIKHRDFKQGQKTYDWPSVNDGLAINTTVTVTGAAFGDECTASMSLAVPANAILTASVTAADTVTVTLNNKTGGALNLASGTLKVTAWK